MTPDGGEAVTRAIRFMMAAELEAVNQYDLIRESTSDPFVKVVLRNIMEEEKKHFGELQALLFTLSPIDASLGSDGSEEAMRYREVTIRPVLEESGLVLTS